MCAVGDIFLCVSVVPMTGLVHEISKDLKQNKPEILFNKFNNYGND